MTPVLDADRVALLQGDCLEVLRSLPENSIDAVVTDPPYGLSFMGKAWDYDVPKAEVWAEVLRVLKPGGHLLSFFGSRTYHRGVCQIEDGGFEIRDSLAWMYGSGFPKSLNVGKAIDAAAGAERKVVGFDASKVRPNRVNRGLVAATGERGHFQADNGATLTAPATPEAAQWEGWGTALKPAHEPIVLARKPLTGTVAANVLAHGTGGLNIDGCRIGTTDERSVIKGTRSRGGILNVIPGSTRTTNPHVGGRWPANVCLGHSADCRESITGDGEVYCASDCPVAMLDAQSGQSSEKPRTLKRNGQRASEGWGLAAESTGTVHADSGGASRFFYCAKTSAAERERGCEHLPSKSGGEATDREDGSIGVENPRAGAGRGGGRRNTHPTVKPIALMRWLVRLVTPPGGTVLDPFTGSGTTGIAALEEGFNFLGIERDPDYCEIAKARLVHALTTKDAA